MIRVVLPAQLRTLAGTGAEVHLELNGPATITGVIDALESGYPQLQGTIRDRQTGKRRPFIRFYALQEDFSHEAPDTLLPAAVASGAEPLVVVGAMSGG